MNTLQGWEIQDPAYIHSKLLPSAQRNKERKILCISSCVLQNGQVLHTLTISNTQNSPSLEL